jgi:hypothetical protein
MPHPTPTRQPADRPMDAEQWFEMRAAFGEDADDIIDVTTGERYNLKTGMIEPAGARPKRRRVFDLGVSIKGGPFRFTTYQTHGEANRQAASLKRILGDRVQTVVQETSA